MVSADVQRMSPATLWADDVPVIRFGSRRRVVCSPGRVSFKAPVTQLRTPRRDPQARSGALLTQEKRDLFQLLASIPLVAGQPVDPRSVEERDRLGVSTMGRELLRPHPGSGDRRFCRSDRHRPGPAKPARCAQLLQRPADDLTRGLHPVLPGCLQGRRRGHQRLHSRIPPRPYGRVPHLHRHGADCPATPATAERRRERRLPGRHDGIRRQLTGVWADCSGGTIRPTAVRRRPDWLWAAARALGDEVPRPPQ